MDINTANRIVQNDTFKKRIHFLMMEKTLSTLLSTTPVPDNADILLGQRVLKGTESIDMWTVATLTASAIMAGAHSENGDTISDEALRAQITVEWAAFKL